MIIMRKMNLINVHFCTYLVLSYDIAITAKGVRN